MILTPSRTGALKRRDAINFFNRNPSTPPAWTKWIWRSIQVQRHSFLTWKFFLNKAPTLSRLLRKGLVQDQTCSLCTVGEETSDHLTLQCPYSRYIFHSLLKDMLIKGPVPKRLSDLPTWLDTKVTHPVKKTIATSMLTTFFWFIWMERNNRIFRGKSLHKRELMGRIKAKITIRLQFSVLKAAISPELIKVAENYGTSISDIPAISKPVQWIPSDSNWLKVNSDGSLSEDRGGYGAIMRDEKGNFIIGAAGQSNPKSINLLEFQGILLGLELGLQIGASRI
ncbi:hypothetical protein QJS04_geneDACA014817 [Acorus gramineus]|uniref:RNase H type-1 domain-containing protein n=1 Tax=Acorus gramineus TaxID=55184 RepID=A0AAV9BP10_ACOGR|nr:hypothetical protein QJS04_geneDACA014817 [Acorus gramineus]